MDKNLKYPYSWEERSPVLKDLVFFVPPYYTQHEPSLFSPWEELFASAPQQPVHIEYCSGNGSWIIAKAKEHPEIHWIAVEKQFERVRQIWAKQQKRGLTNLLIVCGEAYTFTRYYLGEASVAAAYVNFPDPWPKLRHAKHRLLQAPFVAELARIIAAEGTVSLVTDAPLYAQEMRKLMHAQGSWQCAFPPPYYVTTHPGYGSSYFEELWRGKGQEIFYHSYVRRA